MGNLRGGTKIGGYVAYHAGNLLAATPSVDGLLTAVDKTKLNDLNIITASGNNGNIKINGVDTVVYTHPANHDDRYYTESELGSVTSGSSGAKKIGVTSISGITGSEVQTVLESMKTYIDNKTPALVQGAGISISGTTIGLASGVISVPGTYKSVVVDTYGRVTAGTNPTTLAGYGITDAALSTHNHTLDSLTSVSISSKATGDLLKWNGSTWVNFAPTYISGNQTITLSGDATGSGTTAIAVTLKNTGTAGTYTKVTTDAQGRVISGSAMAAGDVPDLGATYLKLSGGTMTGDITLKGDPTSALHPATKQYVDALISGLDIKESVKVATTTNLAALSGLLTVDGYTLVAGDRVLVKDQTNKTQNGIYIAASGAWARSTDADTGSKLSPGTFVFVEQGTTLADTGWVLSTDGSIVLGSTNIIWTQFSGAGTILGDDTTIVKDGNSLSLKTGIMATPGTYAKVTVDTYGRVTGSASLAAGDLPTHTHALANLTDFTVSSPATAQVLRYNGSKWVNAALSNTDVSGSAPLASPTFTGTPAAPTAAADTNTTQIATTAFVLGQAGTTNPAMNGTVAVGTSLRYARQDHVHPVDTSRAPLASPAFTGTPTAPTAAVGTNTTQIATTAYVNAEIVKDAVVNLGSTPSIQAGASGSKPTAGTAGRLYVTTDTNQILRDTGSAWTSVGGTTPVVSTTQPASGLVEGLVWFNPNTFQMKMYVNGAFQNVNNNRIVTETKIVTLGSASSTVAHTLSAFDKDNNNLMVFSNSVFLNANDYSISADGTSIVKSSGTWNSGTEFTFVNTAMIDGTPDKMCDEVITNFYTAASNGLTNIPIGIQQYNSDMDYLEVYHNNVMLYITDNYKINANGTSIDLVGWSLNSGDKIFFKVMKKVRINQNITDASYLMDGTVAKTKLALDVQNSLASADNAAPLASPTFTGTVSVPHLSKVKGTGTGITNQSYIQFMESNNTTRTGWVGDSNSASDDICLGADKGNVQLYVPAGKEVYVNLNNSIYKIWHDGTGAVSKAQAGYQMLPSGLIIQWGTIDITPSAANTRTSKTAMFPITFPNKCCSITVTPLTSAPDICFATPNANNLSGTTIFIIRPDTVTTTVNYMAIGY